MSLACEGDTRLFHDRFAALQQLLSVWEKGEIALITSTSDPHLTSRNDEHTADPDAAEQSRVSIGVLISNTRPAAAVDDSDEELTADNTVEPDQVINACLASDNNERRGTALNIGELNQTGNTSMYADGVCDEDATSPTASGDPQSSGSCSKDQSSSTSRACDEDATASPTASGDPQSSGNCSKDQSSSTSKACDEDAASPTASGDPHSSGSCSKDQSSSTSKALMFPPKIVARGCPKTGKKTALGLARNRRRVCTPFSQKDVDDKRQVLLRNIVAGIRTQDISSDHPVSSQNLDLTAARLPAALLDANAECHHLKPVRHGSNCSK